VHEPDGFSVNVLLFGPAARAAGADSARVHVPAAATVRIVLDALATQRPEIAFALPGARLAVNHAFAQADALVTVDDELALIAMVSGG
jgi:molybdopterin converting factor small subunit